MTLEFFRWAPLDHDDLRVRLDDILQRDRVAYDRTAGDSADFEDRINTQTYRWTVRQRIEQWAVHLEVPIPRTDRYDLSRPAPAGAQREALWIHWQPTIETLLAPLRSGRVYRPRVLETANREVMKWIRTRPSDVDRLHHRSFEIIVAELLKDRGWNVEITKQTRDGGYDIVGIKSDRLGFPMKLLVECKLYHHKRVVGLPMVDRLVGVHHRERASPSMLVTNSRFSGEVWKRWQSEAARDLRLVDRQELLEWLAEEIA
jgi:hypothetical protein